MVTFHNRKFN